MPTSYQLKVMLVNYHNFDKPPGATIYDPLIEKMW